MQSRSFTFSPNFNFSNNDLLFFNNNQESAPFPPGEGDFELLDGTNLMLLDGTNLVLL